MSTFSNINIDIGKVINTVNTIADLRNYKPRSIRDGDTIIVSAGSSLGDAEGGAFVWTEGSTVADDGADAIKPVFAVGSGRWVKAFGKGDRGLVGPKGDQGEASTVPGPKGERGDGLATVMAPNGSELIGYGSRTLASKLADDVSVLDYGAKGDGATNDTAAINAAIAVGKTVNFPKGYTFVTSGNHQITTSGQQFRIEGKVVHDGVRRDLGGVYGYEGLFLIMDQVSGVEFSGSGTLDGKRANFTGGDRGSGIQAWRAPNIRVSGLRFTGFIDDGIKAHNCPNLITTATCTFENIHNIGVELRSYYNDPRTGSAWSGPVSGPSGTIDGYFDNINDYLHGAGNGCGVDFSPADKAPVISNLRVAGRYRDCLRAIFSENNYPATTSVKDIVIDSPIIEGSVRGPTTNETKDGIGLINCKNVQIISPVIRNVGNYAPPGGSSAGIQLSGANLSDIYISNPQITEDRTSGARTDYAINIAAGCTDIQIVGGTISPMDKGQIVRHSSVTNLRIHSVKGATDDDSWSQIVPFTFHIASLPASANTALLWNGLAGHDAVILPTNGRIVAASARLVAGYTGTLDIQVTAGGIAQSGVAIPNDLFGGGATAVKRIASTSAPQQMVGSQVMVTANTSAFSGTTTPVVVTVYVDISMKQ